MILDGVNLNDNVMVVLSFIQRNNYRNRYEEALLKVMESFILDEELPPDEAWDVVRIFSELRRDLKALSGQSSPDQVET